MNMKPKPNSFIKKKYGINKFSFFMISNNGNNSITDSFSSMTKEINIKYIEIINNYLLERKLRNKLQTKFKDKVKKI